MAFVDLKPYTDRVTDQGTTNSCTANAVCNALEMLLHRDGRYRPLSRLFLYWNARESRNELSTDNGTNLARVIQEAQDLGVCDESVWEFSQSNVFNKPTAEAYAQATRHKVTHYEECQDWKAALDEGLPVICAFGIPSEFFSLKGDWRTHQWGAGGNTFSHAIIIIGYDDDAKMALGENSWGSNWGDSGFFGIPYARMADSLQSSYVIRGFDGVEFVRKPPLSTKDIHAIYKRCLGRAAKQTELKFWIAEISTKAVVQYLLLSAEFQKTHTTINSVYKAALGRPVSPADYADFVNQVMEKL